VERRERGKVKK
jgi:hypothetical protein